MKPEEFENHLTGCINAAIKAEVHPALILGAIKVIEFQLVQLLMHPPKPPTPEENNRIIRLDD